MAQANQLLDTMLAVCRERLSGRDPVQIAQRAGVEFAGGAFRFSSLGGGVCVAWPDFEVSPAMSHWQLLTLLHYLDIADGAPILERQMPFARCRDGMVRGGGFDRDAENMIREKIGRLDEDSLKARCLALGGRMLPSNADLCVRFEFAPRYPLWLKLWFADDEFPASGRVFVDESADHYLTIEDAVTVGGLLLERLADG